jgi:hypothetical protein
MEGFKSEKERLLKQFLASKPLGMKDAYGDLEDVELELDYMIEEGIDLKEITVRDLLKRF